MLRATGCRDGSWVKFNRRSDQECVGIGGLVDMQFEIGDGYDQGGVRYFAYDAKRPAVLKWDLVGLCMDGNWENWV